MSQEPVCHFKTIYWHASDFLPTVLVHLRRTVFKWILSKLAILTYFVCIWSFRHAQSWPFWHILCVFDRFDMPKAQSIICLSVLEYSKQACTCAHTHTQLQPGEQRLSCGLCFQRFIIKHVQQFSNSKDSILQQSPIELILTLRFV